jgi:hypothetical protein
MDQLDLQGGNSRLQGLSYIEIDRQIDRQTDVHTYIHTYIQTDRQTDTNTLELGGGEVGLQLVHLCTASM